MAVPAARWIRLGVSAGAFAILLTIVPLESLLRALRSVSAGTLVSALLLFVAGHVVAAAKWRWLCDDTGVPVRATLRAHFSGVIANLWLPSVVGGDVVRAGLIYRRASRPAVVAVASLVDRVIDSGGLLVLAALGALLVGLPSDGARDVIVAVVALAIAGAAAAAAGYWYVRSRATNRLRQVVQAFEFVVGRPSRVVAALALSVAVQATFIGVNLMLGRAVGVAAPVGVWLMAWPLAKLAALLPISVAGLGVREAALVVLMQPFGDSADSILAAGVLWQAVFMSGGALGWGVLALVPEPATAPVDELRVSRE
jgi:uncharacterized membrane protein YbhN (UPF0104 family)